MEKKTLISIIDNLLKPIGFRRKGNTWIMETEELKKLVNLQKSKYGNIFYLNYGYIIKKIELQDLEMHIYNRLSSLEDSENKRLMDLLDCENDIDDRIRINELCNLVKSHILVRFNNINSEQDLFNELKKRPNLNDVPLVVKSHFNLVE